MFYCDLFQYFVACPFFVMLPSSEFWEAAKIFGEGIKEIERQDACFNGDHFGWLSVTTPTVTQANVINGEKQRNKSL